jgi:NinB protein
MSKLMIVLNSHHNRKRVIELASNSVDGTRVEFNGPKRSLSQNSKLWSLLSDIVRQKKTIDNQEFESEEWKCIFLQALGREPDILPTLDGTGFFETGHSSSKLSKETMSELIEFITAWGAENGVQWSDPQLESYEEMRR